MPELGLAAFEAALDSFGADIAGWPLPMRQPALDLLAGSEPARRQHAAMQAIEAGLRSAQPAAPTGLADRIIAKALKPDSGDDRS